MVLVLCIGDLHVPHRAAGLPARFKALLVPGRIHHVLCTGNLCTKETFDFLKSVCPDVRVCRGDFDSSEVISAAAAAASAASSSSEAASPSSGVAPSGDEDVLAVGGLRLGLAPSPPDEDPEGNASDLLARRMDVDVLVAGGGGKRGPFELRSSARGGRLFVDPGSATGAWSPTSSPSPSASVPSFVLMDVSEGRAVVYMYRLLRKGDGTEELKVEKTEFRKGGGGGAAKAAASPAAAKKAAPAAAPPAATSTAAAAQAS